MAFQLNQNFNVESFKAASIIQMGAAVQLNLSGAFSVLPASAASAGVAPVYGLAVATGASAGTYGQSLPVQTGGWGKGLAAASLGIGAYVAAGIGTSSLVPIVPSGVASVLFGAIQFPRYAVGIALENAAAGQLFTVSIKPGLEIF